MGRQTKTKPAWAPVQVQHELTIKGGHMKRPQVVPTKHFVFEEKAVCMVAIGKSESWLAPMCSGKCVSTRPMSRCRIFKLLWDALGGEDEPEQPAGEDKMAMLEFEGGADSASDSQPSSSPGGDERKKKAAKNAKYHGPVVMRVCVPACASAAADPPALAAAGETRVIACREKKKLFIEMDALPWLVNYAREELESGGVAPIPKEPAADTPSIYWDFTNDCWTARVEDEFGKKSQKVRVGVKARMRRGKDLALFDFAEAKQKVYDEMLAAIAAGLPLTSIKGSSGDVSPGEGSPP